MSGQRAPDEIKLSEENVHRAGAAAMNAQLHYYFLLRDFTLPALTAMKSRVSAHIRRIRSAPLPGELVEQANSLASIIQGRRAFEYRDLQQPFTISAVKVMSARDIKFQSDVDDPVEQARWTGVYLQALTKSLYGRRKDIEALISCGVLNQQARSLANRKSDD